jgi:hypothetical protein
MASSSRIFYRLLLVATAINLVGLPFAVLQQEPWHATLHAVLALGCGFWALRLRHRRPSTQLPDSSAAPDALTSGDEEALRDAWVRQREAEREEREL